MKPAFFYEKKSATVAKRIKDSINKHEAFLTKDPPIVPGQSGTLCKALLKQNFQLLPKNGLHPMASSFAGRFLWVVNLKLALAPCASFQYAKARFAQGLSDRVHSNMPAMIGCPRTELEPIRVAQCF